MSTYRYTIPCGSIDTYPHHISGYTNYIPAIGETGSITVTAYVEHSNANYASYDGLLITSDGTNPLQQTYYRGGGAIWNVGPSGIIRYNRVSENELIITDFSDLPYEPAADMFFKGSYARGSSPGTPITDAPATLDAAPLGNPGGHPSDAFYYGMLSPLGSYTISPFILDPSTGQLGIIITNGHMNGTRGPGAFTLGLPATTTYQQAAYDIQISTIIDITPDSTFNPVWGAFSNKIIQRRRI
jgi:hypothetical protein